jgi:hypothetical protein
LVLEIVIQFLCVKDLKAYVHRCYTCFLFVFDDVKLQRCRFFVTGVVHEMRNEMDEMKFLSSKALLLFDPFYSYRDALTGRNFTLAVNSGRQ